MRTVASSILEEIFRSGLTLDEVLLSLKEFQKLVGRYKKMVESYAKKNENSLKLNPDRERVHELVVSLARNKIDFGKAFCPCMVMRISGDPSEDVRRICPCAWHKRDIELDGQCECGMFVKP